MIHTTLRRDGFPAVSGKKVEVDFDGGHVSSIGGSLLLRQVDELTGLTAGLCRLLKDSRQKSKVGHTLLHLLRQRIYAIACGEEDLNDHDELRDDLALQTAVGKDSALGSPSTLCRLENRMDREWIALVHQVLFDDFVRSFESPPEELILDFDASDVPIHGDQELKQFHGYYDHYCYLPLYVFCGDHLLTCYLRPSRIDAAKHAGGILKILVDRIREEWSGVRIVFRGDSGFCRDRILRWCERNGVDYLVGIARNPRLERIAAPHLVAAKSAFESDGEKRTLFAESIYAAGPWETERRLIVKAEHLPKGSNPRFLVTNMPEDGELLYRKVYCARGDAENRIKEQQLDLFGTRTSASRFLVNQFRILLSGLAYTLIKSLKRLALQGTKLKNAYCRTIREKLFRIGAVITRNTRRIRIHLSSASPMTRVFANAWNQLASLKIE